MLPSQVDGTLMPEKMNSVLYLETHNKAVGVKREICISQTGEDKIVNRESGKRNSVQNHEGVHQGQRQGKYLFRQFGLVIAHKRQLEVRVQKSKGNRSRCHEEPVCSFLFWKQEVARVAALLTV